MLRLAALAALFASVMPLPRAEAQLAAARRGEKFAVEYCSRCHAVKLSGRSRLREAPPFRRIAMRYPPEQMQEALAEGIMVGHPAMPEFELTPNQIDDLIAHLRRLRR